jgi:hypothetical protein
VLYSSLLSELPWLDHGFGTREDALSPQKMASLKQIHSAVVWIIEQPGYAGEGDALVTDQTGVSVSVRTADCYPILLADQRRGAVAAVHAGWRGTAAGIVAKTIQRMHERFGNDAGDLRVAIGPGIGACCYEVGLDVALQFGFERAGCIDLAEINRLQLVAAGASKVKSTLSGDARNATRSGFTPTGAITKTPAGWCLSSRGFKIIRARQPKRPRARKKQERLAGLSRVNHQVVEALRAIGLIAVSGFLTLNTEGSPRHRR